MSSVRMLARLLPRGARSVYTGTSKDHFNAHLSELEAHLPWLDEATKKDLRQWLAHSHHNHKNHPEHIHIDIHEEKKIGKNLVSRDVHVDIDVHPETQHHATPKRHR